MGTIHLMDAISVSIRSRDGVEPLLGPILDLVARRGPIRVAEIVGQRAQQGLLGPVARQDLPNVVTEAGQAVAWAARVLRESGLLAFEDRGVYRVTSAGSRLLRSGEAPISFKTLNRRPRYKEYLQRLASEKRRRDWQVLRFEYYVSGRLLTFDESFHAAPAMLAYALEYSLKAALTEMRSGLIPRPS